MRLASGPPSAVRLARGAMALTVLALLAVALFALYDTACPILSILGLLLAVTPMALFSAAILNGSGVEIASSIAFFSCLLRLARSRVQRPAWWIATAVAGAVFALSRPASPGWLVAALAVGIVWAHRTRTFARWRQDRAAWLAGCVVALAWSG